MPICDICKYKTEKQSNYMKHVETEKHKLNVKLGIKFDTHPKQIICEYCQIIFNNDKSHINHIKLCLKNPNNKLCIHCNLIFNKETTFVNHFELCANNKITELKNCVNKLEISNKKIDDELKKYLYDTANRANNNVSNNTSNNTSINLYFNNVPIKLLDNFDIY